MSASVDPRWYRAEQIRVAFDAYRVHALALRQRRDREALPNEVEPVPADQAPRLKTATNRGSLSARGVA